MPIKRILIFLAVVALAGTLAWAIWAPKPQTGQFVRLPDGTVLTLADVTYGPTNTLVLGRPFQKYLYKILPTNFARWSGCDTAVWVSGGISTNCPVFWFRELRKNGESSPPGGFYIAAVDEYGCDYDTVNAANFGGRNRVTFGQNSFDAYLADPPWYPHGQVKGLVFYDSPTKTNRLGMILIPGTVLPPARSDTAVPLAEGDAGELHLQLWDLTTGLKTMPYPSSYTAGSTNGTVFSQATLGLTENGGPAKDWVVGIIYIDNPQTEWAMPRYHTLATRDGDTVYNFDATLDPTNGPWHLRIDLSHLKNGEMGEMITVSNIPFAGPGQVVDVGRQVNAEGETLEIEKVYGENSQRDQRQSMLFSQKPFIQWKLTPVETDVSVNLNSMVIEGKPVYAVGGGYGSRPAGEMYVSLNLTNTVKTMDLVFDVRRSRIVKLDVNSKWFSTNSAGGK